MQKKLDKAVVGEICLKTINTELSHQIEIEGYLKFGKLFLKTSDQYLKIEIFQKKRKLIETLNNRLEDIGFPPLVQDIYTK